MINTDCEICADRLSTIQCTRCVYRWCNHCDHRLHQCPYCRLPRRKPHRFARHRHFIFDLFYDSDEDIDEYVNEYVNTPVLHTYRNLANRIKILFLFLYFFQVFIIINFVDVLRKSYNSLIQWYY